MNFSVSLEISIFLYGILMYLSAAKEHYKDCTTGCT